MRSESTKAFLGWVLALLAALALAGCGSGSQREPAGTAVVIGKMAPAGALQAAKQLLADPALIEVYVQGHEEIRTTVAADGTFTLRGLPEGSFSLVFSVNGTPVGVPMLFEEVAPNQQITITISVDDPAAPTEVVLVDEDRRGIGHAGIELEGLVQNVVTLNPTGDSTFVIAGRTVIARPGVTAIRKGNTRLTVNDVLVGLRVHVKGTLIENTTDILAYEIKIQSEGETGGTGTKMTICHHPGGDPNKKHTIEISSNAWPAHQKHGDTEGACSP